MNKCPSVGLALGGGFLRGAAHVGVLKVLLEENIPVHAVVGSSSGSIAASMFAAGYEPEDIEKKMNNLNVFDVFDGFGAIQNIFLLALGTVAERIRLPFPFSIPTGLLPGKNLESTIERLLGISTRLGECRNVCLAVTAVDVRNGELVLFMPGEVTINSIQPLTVIPPQEIETVSDVEISKAVRASCSIPGLFEPKIINGKKLVDGGVRENVPARILRKMEMDVVIAVDVGYDGQVLHQVSSIFDVLSQSIDIMASENVLYKLREYADIVIMPEIKDISVWDYNKMSYAVKQGENRARELLPEIRRLTGVKGCN
ncbi:MAG: patatin-like phospholipase family protein [Clostridiales bacterium]|nr:patatin-like phospholipase family protein [Clostridiales bacterium]MCF8021373.1 patatin-like phospholipase family protein [Clostridiales bacterium]